MPKRVIFAGMSVKAQLLVIDEEGGHVVAQRPAEVSFTTLEEARTLLLPGLFDVIQNLDREFNMGPIADPTTDLQGEGPPG